MKSYPNVRSLLVMMSLCVTKMPPDTAGDVEIVQSAELARIELEGNRRSGAT
ncbi:hypothetical protein M407DRAFT_185603 [Tulasnella calospora MUT 4182]|uniref:Uncharacterized protein n=1 Tax=Tulasnella calospora MUT 4182 TaxID=1051891 RepID=A0A0C3QKS7_9AGAM|nr:hypothetical protein M407DRAFT_185603 [Tulasnella calospora MUT 4182]